MAAAKNEIVPTEKSGELIDIAIKAMASKPEDRYSTVQDLQNAVRAYQSHIESIALGARAQEDLEEARQTDKYDTFARALFQQARIFMKRGQLDLAESNLRQVLAAFPRDRMSLQQLGELCKIKRDYTGALESYDKIMQIDPEDVGAHYNLMLIYRKLGRIDDAKREAKIFADLKDDPGALSLANQFLRKHPEMSNESVYWHIHDLARTP